MFIFLCFFTVTLHTRLCVEYTLTSTDCFGGHLSNCRSIGSTWQENRKSVRDIGDAR
ncbi:hypothetical protein Ancab_023441, partial [Ancistrocladus abbreviatus]